VTASAPGWEFLGTATTAEGHRRAVWRHDGKIYTANLEDGEPLIDGIPMGARLAPIGIAREFEGG
jgi:hypothetical protein